MAREFTPTTATGTARAYVPGQAAPAPVPVAPPKDNLQTRTMTQQAEGAQKIATSVKKGAEYMQKPGIGNKIEGAAISGFGTITGAAQAFLAPVTAVTSPLAKTMFEGFKNTHPGLMAAYNALAPAAQKALEPTLSKIKEFTDKHPDETTLAGDVLNTALLAIGGGEAKAVTPELSVAGAKEVATAVKEDVAGAVKGAPGKVKDMYINSEKKSWTKPVTANKAGFKTVSKIYNNAAKQGHKIEETLLNSGIKLSDNVENGSYNTADTASNLRETTGKTSTELLRPSLEAADAYTPKTPVDKIFTDAEKNLRDNKDITAGDLETGLSRLKKEKVALEKKYPDGMKLTDMHDEKITYDKNAGYKPEKGSTAADTLTGQTNKALADANRTGVETAAPPEIPVHDFNKELTKSYQAADYLDALHTKTVPIGTVSKIANRAAKLAGAAVGAATGGGILADIGGYQLGGTLEKAFENFTDPVKSMILNSLEKTQPEAFAKLKTYIGDQEAGRLTRKALPEPSFRPMGGTDKAGYNIDAAGTKTPAKVEGQIGVAAKKNPVSVDPKTGKFQTTYSSSDLTTKSVPKAMSNSTNKGISGSITQNVPKVNVSNIRNIMERLQVNGYSKDEILQIMKKMLKKNPSGKFTFADVIKNEKPLKGKLKP